MSGVARTGGSSFAMPYAFAYASWPFLTTATVALGTPVDCKIWLVSESTREPIEVVAPPCANAEAPRKNVELIATRELTERIKVIPMVRVIRAR